MSLKIDGHISECDMATKFGIGVWGLRAWRKRKYGPPIVKFGRKIFYRESDVQTFIDAQGGQNGN